MPGTVVTSESAASSRPGGAVGSPQSAWAAGESAASSRPGGAVGSPESAWWCSPQPAVGLGGRGVGLRGFASPDVLEYRLAVFGVSVSNYSDSSPQASGQLWQSWAEVFWRVFVEMIMKEDKVSPRGYIK